MKPKKVLAIPSIITLVLPAFLIFTLFTSPVRALITFADDVLAFWETLVEWWEE